MHTSYMLSNLLFCNVFFKRGINKPGLPDLWQLYKMKSYSERYNFAHCNFSAMPHCTFPGIQIFRPKLYKRGVVSRKLAWTIWICDNSVLIFCKWYLFLKGTVQNADCCAMQFLHNAIFVPCNICTMQDLDFQKRHPVVTPAWC